MWRALESEWVDGCSLPWACRPGRRHPVRGAAVAFHVPATLASAPSRPPLRPYTQPPAPLSRLPRWGLGFPGSTGDPIEKGCTEYFGVPDQSDAHGACVREVWGLEVVL